MADSRQGIVRDVLFIFVVAIGVWLSSLIDERDATIRSLRQQLSQQATVIERNCGKEK